MGNRISLLLVVLLAVTSFTGIYGQKSGKKITITGFVDDETNTPIANAIIMINGEKTDNVTNSKGFY